MQRWLMATLAFAVLGTGCSPDVEPTQGPAMSAEAREYLDQAIDLVEENAYHADRIDWTSARNATHLQAAGAVTPRETHTAIRSLLASLKDGHSGLMPPAVLERFESGRLDEPDFGIRTALKGRHGYVLVPGFVGGTNARSTGYTDTVQQGIAALDGQRVCGWIVDLRDNTGGNMYPMIRGLAALLGEGTLGYFAGREGRNPWHVGLASPGDKEPPFPPRLLEAPVAVLVGPNTASSGEAALLSFIGRPNTRTFGEPSAGLSTANRAFPLPDGALLVITTSIMADRSGKTYGRHVAPDQIVVSLARRAADDDEVARAAGDWLDAQPACQVAQRGVPAPPPASAAR